MRRTRMMAEIGINHNGDMGIVRKMIETAAAAGCDAVKFQKRTIEKVYTKEFLDSPRQSQWGTTQREQKMGLELTRENYEEIDRLCRSLGIDWFASAWDVDSQLFLREFSLNINKIASAMLTNMPLLETVAEEGRHTFVATGMSTWDEIDAAVEVFRRHKCPFELVHCVAVYPMEPHEANLLMIPAMRERYGCDVGYSCHELGNLTSVGSVALGVSSIERHFTLDRTMPGSDQSSSIEPDELRALIRDVRIMERALGDGQRVLSERELASRKKLRPSA